MVWTCLNHQRLRTKHRTPSTHLGYWDALHVRQPIGIVKSNNYVGWRRNKNMRRSWNYQISKYIYIYTYEFIQILIPTVSYITRLVRWFLGIIYMWNKTCYQPILPTTFHYHHLTLSEKAPGKRCNNSVTSSLPMPFRRNEGATWHRVVTLKSMCFSWPKYGTSWYIHFIPFLVTLATSNYSI